MENKSYGEILFDANKEFWSKFNDKKKDLTWKTLSDTDRETYDYCGDILIQYYEDYILEEFLNKHREDDSK